VWKVFNQALESLDTETRSIIILHEKVQIESGLAEQYKTNSNINSWERLWLKNINKCYELTLLGTCEECMKTYPLTVDYFTYKQGLFILHDRELLVVDCKKCNSKESFFISTFLHRKQLFQ
jgi:hypothetical protein